LACVTIHRSPQRSTRSATTAHGPVSSCATPAAMVVMETCDGSRRALTLLGALECDSLHALLRESNENGERCREHERDSAVLGRCLLLDCRSFLAFSSSHIRGSLNVHSNPILLRRRVRRHHGPGPGLLPLSQLVPSADARARLQAGLY